MGGRIGDEFTSRSRSRLAAIATDRGETERATVARRRRGDGEGPEDGVAAGRAADYERMLAELPKAMGAEEFERVRSNGQSLSPSDAVALALARGADSPGELESIATPDGDER